MILSTHILAAAAVTRSLAASVHPAVLFFIALASHYLLDAIPHKDYQLSSVKTGIVGGRQEVIDVDFRKIPRDIVKVFFDIAVGTLVVYLIYRPEFNFSSILPFAVIVAGAVLPDILEPFYWFYKKPLTIYIHRLHRFFHTGFILPFDFLGYLIQGIVIVLSLTVLLI